MRQLSAVALLVSVSLSLTGRVLSVDSDEQLPACCRRDGKHQCGMLQTSDEPYSGVAIRGIKRRCADFPAATPCPVGGKAPVPRQSYTFAVPLLSQPTGPAQTQARYRISFIRSAHERGPPASQ